MNARLIHYTPTPFALVQGRTEQLVGYKPKGLWVSVEGEDDWLSWCEAEEFRLGHLAYASAVTLKPRASILRVGSLASFDAFNASFGDSAALGFRVIDWIAVARKYEGIIIAPYQWHRRLVGNWYYGWDCASGCIWDTDAIESVTAIESPKIEKGRAA